MVIQGPLYPKKQMSQIPQRRRICFKGIDSGLISSSIVSFVFFLSFFNYLVLAYLSCKFCNNLKSNSRERKRKTRKKSHLELPRSFEKKSWPRKITFEHPKKK